MECKKFLSHNIEAKMQTDSLNGKHRIEDIYNILNIEYKTFHNIQEIGKGSYGSKVYRATWKNSQKYCALKSFFNLDDATEKKIIHEVIAEYTI